MGGEAGYDSWQSPRTPYAEFNNLQNGMFGLFKSDSPEQKAYKKAIGELDDFKDKIYPPAPTRITPSTKMGHLICQYEPLPGVLTIYVKCNFKFVSEPGKKITPEELQKATDEHRAPVLVDDADPWDPVVVKKWKENFLTQSLRWSNVFMFYCQKDWWEQLTAFVMVKFTEAGPSEQPDLNVSIFKEPTVKATNVRGYGGILEFNPFSKSIVIVHELGHVLGLGDEYVDRDQPETAGQPALHSALVEKEFGYPVLRGAWKKNSVMLLGPDGNEVLIEHGVTFLEALRLITGMQDWKFTRKQPRPVPK